MVLLRDTLNNMTRAYEKQVRFNNKQLKEKYIYEKETAEISWICNGEDIFLPGVLWVVRTGPLHILLQTFVPNKRCVPQCVSK